MRAGGSKRSRASASEPTSPHIKFASGTKAYDGLEPAHYLFDTLVAAWCAQSVLPSAQHSLSALSFMSAPPSAYPPWLCTMCERAYDFAHHDAAMLACLAGLAWDLIERASVLPYAAQPEEEEEAAALPPSPPPPAASASALPEDLGTFALPPPDPQTTLYEQHLERLSSSALATAAALGYAAGRRTAVPILARGGGNCRLLPTALLPSIRELHGLLRMAAALFAEPPHPAASSSSSSSSSAASVGTSSAGAGSGSEAEEEEEEEEEEVEEETENEEGQPPRKVARTARTENA